MDIYFPENAWSIYFIWAWACMLWDGYGVVRTVGVMVGRHFLSSFRFGLCYFNHILGRTWLYLQPWHMVCMQGRQTAAADVSHPNTFETMLELRCVDRLWLLLLNYPVRSTSA